MNPRKKVNAHDTTIADKVAQCVHIVIITISHSRAKIPRFYLRVYEVLMVLHNTYISKVMWQHDINTWCMIISWGFIDEYRKIALFL